MLQRRPGSAMSHFVVITNNAGLYLGENRLYLGENRLYLGENIVAPVHTDYAFCLEDVKI
jgi:hypothetical protein